MKTEIKEKVQELILQARKLEFSDNSYTSNNGTFGEVGPKLKDWYERCEKLILEEAGVYSKPWEKFESIDLKVVNGNYQDKFDLLKKTVTTALKELVIQPEAEKNLQRNESKSQNSEKSIFIVHGHEEGIKNKVARFIENLGYKPIILHEQASTGKTIIEKLETYSNVRFGIVLYTGCDEGRKAKEDQILKKRARQNVVFEHGYLIAKIGRNNVCALVENVVEIPNDISGIIYIEIDINDAWKFSLVREMKDSGLEVDMNKII